jgi:hypothetical protein
MRPQSALPSSRREIQEEKEGSGDVEKYRVPTRDIRLNLQDNESFYRAPSAARSRREPTSKHPSSRPTSAPPVRTFVPGVLLPTTTERDGPTPLLHAVFDFAPSLGLPMILCMCLLP